MKVLIIPIEGKWLLKQIQGEKGEEYRDIKRYWTSRFAKQLGFIDKKGHPDGEALLAYLIEQGESRSFDVMYRAGYAASCPTYRVTVTLRIGEGREEWGAWQGKTYYILTPQGPFTEVKEEAQEKGT